MHGSIDFSTNFVLNSLASGCAATEALYTGPLAGGGRNISRNRKNCCRKMMLFSMAVQNDRGQGRSDKYRLKINCRLRFSYQNSKVFSKISNLNWGLAKTHKDLLLCFLISFRVTEDFQQTIKRTWILFKFPSKIKISLIIYDNFQKIAGYHWLVD